MTEVTTSEVDRRLELDDKGIAVAFVRHLQSQGWQISLSSSNTVYLYDPRRGIWVALDEAQMRKFDDRLSDFARRRLAGAGKAGITASRLNSIRNLLFSTVSEVFVPLSSFNSNHGLIALRNGVYDLDANRLLPHDPAHRLTTYRDFDFDPVAECPRFDRFLEEVLVSHSEPDDDTSPLVPDASLRMVVQEMLGYCLTTHCRAERCFYLFGEGRNGKSKLIEVLTGIVGEQNVAAAFDVRMLSKPENNVDLVNRLVAIQSELDAGTQLPDGKVKALASGEPLRARNLYNDSFTFRPFAKLVMVGNNLPKTRDKSLGLWARTVVIPFYARFEGEADDKELSAKLRAELSGIFRWAVEGYQRLRDNHWKFTVSAAAERAKSEYRLETDSILNWFEDWVRPAPHQVTISTHELYDSYTAYCRRFHYQAVTMVNFAKRLRRIVDAGDAEVWRQAAAEGVPFWMSFTRSSHERGYTGCFSVRQS